MNVVVVATHLANYKLLIEGKRKQLSDVKTQKMLVHRLMNLGAT